MQNKQELVVIALDGAVPSFILEAVDKGLLPSFRKLIDSGCWFRDCRPPFPTITPTCWASFSTGATPATHGAVCQDIHLPGTPLDKLVSAYHSGNIHAERFWEAASLIGKKSLVIQLPTSGPAKSKTIMQIGGAGTSAIVSYSPDKPTKPASFHVQAQFFVSGEDDSNSIQWGSYSPASGQWQPASHFEKDFIQMGDSNVVSLNVDTQGSSSKVKPFNWIVKVGKDIVELAESMEHYRQGMIVKLKVGEWTDTLERCLECENGRRTFKYRVKLIKADHEKSELIIFFTQMGDVAEHTSPEEYAAEVTQVPGIAANHGHYKLLRDISYMDTFLEAEAMNYEWQWEVLKRTWEKHAVDISIVYSVFLDTLNHRYRNILEGLCKVDENKYSLVKQIFNKGYKLADDFIGKILDYCSDETTIVVLSDHGSVGHESTINPFEVLEKAGLLVYEKNKNNAERIIDWNKTTAYPVGTCHIFVNLEGRDPNGIVPSKDYDRIVHKIIRVLQDGFRDEARQINSLAFAVPGNQAGFIGLGGPYIGDVVYGVLGSKVGGYIGGVHGCQIPTAKTDTGGIRSLLLAAGPGFKAGVKIEQPVNFIDIAPTLCFALGYPQPANAEGAVVFQALNEN